MDHCLDELFSVILHSEKVVMDEKKRCKEVKEKIKTMHLRVERQAEIKTEYTQKTEKLTDGLFQSILGTKFIKSKEEYLIKNLKLIWIEIASDTEKLENLNIHYENSSKTFMSLVQDFSINYGFSNSRRNTRESMTRTDLKCLSAKVNTLSHELQSLNTRNREISDVVSRMQEIKELKILVESQRKEYENKIEKVEYQILQLHKQRLQLEMLPDTDKSFTLLNDELQQYQTIELEKTARDLQAQLNQLLVAVRQKEGQKLRQQYRLWQRQRQQMLRQERTKKDNQFQQPSLAARAKTTGKQVCAVDDNVEDKAIAKSSQDIHSA